MTPEELAEQQKRIAELAKATRVVKFEIDGTTAQYELFFVHSYTTNGGMMYDLTITYEEKETRHRIILGKEYYEDFDMEPEHVVAMVFTFLLQKKEPRHTEGATSCIFLGFAAHATTSCAFCVQLVLQNRLQRMAWYAQAARVQHFVSGDSAHYADFQAIVSHSIELYC